MDLLDAVVDRSADILERIGAEVDQISHSIFEPEAGTAEPPTYKGAQGARPQGRFDLKSARKPGVDRPVAAVPHDRGGGHEVAIKTSVLICNRCARDTASLSDHASYLSSKITFLLDAMLGVVNIEQNEIIKIFSIAAVVFMPPTLVASIYGMNFHKGMIELEWDFGYPFALILMVFAAILPILYFKWRKWL